MKYNTKKIFELCDNWADKVKTSWERGDKAIEFVQQNKQWSEDSLADDSKERFAFNQINKSLKEAQANGRDIDLSLTVSSCSGNSDAKEQKTFKLMIDDLMLNGENSRELALSLDNVYSYGQSVFHVKPVRENERTLNQILKIECIKDVKRTFFDPQAMSPTFHDGKFCGRKYLISGESLKQKYKSKLKNFDTKKEDNEVIDFWYKKQVNVDYIPLTTGEYKREDLIDKASDNRLFDKPPIKSTMTKICYIRCLKDYDTFLAGSTELDFEFLPMVLNNGGMSWLGNEIDTYPLGFYLFDAQILLNYGASTVGDMMKTQTADKYLVSAKHMQSKAAQNTLNNINTLSGVGIVDGNPQDIMRIVSSEIPQSLLAFIGQMPQMMQSLAGSEYNTDAKLREISGVALDKIYNRQDLVQNIAIIAHLNAVNIVGEIIKSMIPTYYTEQRTLSIKDNSGKITEIVINKKKEQQNGMIIIENNISDLTKRYNYEISVSVSKNMQKKNTNTQLELLYQMYPQAIPATIDIYAKSLDIQSSDIIAKRLGANIPQILVQYANGDITLEEYQQKMEEQAMAQKENQEQEMKNNPQVKFMNAKTQGEIIKGQVSQFNSQTSRMKEESSSHNTQMGNVNDAIKIHYENQNTKEHTQLELLKTHLEKANQLVEKLV